VGRKNSLLLVWRGRIPKGKKRRTISGKNRTVFFVCILEKKKEGGIWALLGKGGKGGRGPSVRGGKQIGRAFEANEKGCCKSGNTAGSLKAPRLFSQ